MRFRVPGFWVPRLASRFRCVPRARFFWFRVRRSGCGPARNYPEPGTRNQEPTNRGTRDAPGTGTQPGLRTRNPEPPPAFQRVTTYPIPRFRRCGVQRGDILVDKRLHLARRRLSSAWSTATSPSSPASAARRPRRRRPSAAPTVNTASRRPAARGCRRSLRAVGLCSCRSSTSQRAAIRSPLSEELARVRARLEQAAPRRDLLPHHAQLVDQHASVGESSRTWITNASCASRSRQRPWRADRVTTRTVVVTVRPSAADARRVGAGRHHRPALRIPASIRALAIFFAPSRVRSHTARSTPGSVGSAFFGRASSSSSASGSSSFGSGTLLETAHQALLRVEDLDRQLALRLALEK